MWLKEKIWGGKKKQETVTLLIPDEALAIIETSDLEGAKALTLEVFPGLRQETLASLDLCR